MRYFGMPSQIGDVKVGLFALWFGVISTTIASYFGYTTLIGLISGQMDLFSIMFGTLVTLATGFIAVVADTVTLVMFFGSSTSLTGPGVGETQRVITLFGLELLRSVYGPWYDLRPAPPPNDCDGVVWSWAAFDNRKTTESKGAPEVVEAAIWNLLAHDYARLRARSERHSLLYGLISRVIPRQLYILRGSAPAGQVEGAWEHKLITALHAERSQPDLDVYTWVITAFGDTVSNPVKEAIAFVEQDYVAKRWGQYTGRFIKQLEWEARPEHVALWPRLRAYMTSHNREIPGLDQLMQTTILKALKNRVDAS